jgi:hypothetical protein
VPDKWKSAARVSWFYDMGNVFQTGNKVQVPGESMTLTPVNYHFVMIRLKRSTGIAVQWLAPAGSVPFLLRRPVECVPGRYGQVQRRNRAFSVFHRSSVLTPHSRTHRLETRRGGTDIHLGDRCVIAFTPLPFPVCSLGQRDANGDLFKHMLDPPHPGDLKDPP